VEKALLPLKGRDALFRAETKYKPSRTEVFKKRRSWVERGNHRGKTEASPWVESQKNKKVDLASKHTVERRENLPLKLVLPLSRRPQGKETSLRPGEKKHRSYV